MLTRWSLPQIGQPLPCLVCPPPPCLECPPDIFQFTSELDFQYSTDGGQTFRQASAPVETKVRVKHAENTPDARISEAEILAPDVPARALPGPTLLPQMPPPAPKANT